jgi:hypothetical protein
VKGRDEIDGDDQIPLVDREILDRRHVLNAGIIDQHIERAEARLSTFDHVGDLIGLGHVGRRICGLDAEILLDAGALFLNSVLVAEAVDGDIGALRGEGAGHGETDARG